MNLIKKIRWKSIGNIISKASITINKLYGCRPILAPLLVGCCYKFYFTVSPESELRPSVLSGGIRLLLFDQLRNAAWLLEVLELGDDELLFILWYSSMTVIFQAWQEFIAITQLVGKNTEKDINGNFFFLFPFQSIASVYKELRDRIRHISREYHKQHRNRTFLYTIAACNNPVKFLQPLWTDIQPHWETLVDNEVFQAKPTFPPTLTDSTTYTADISLGSTHLHDCSCNDLASLHSRNTHFL